MSPRSKPKNTVYLILLVLAVLLASVGLVILDPPGSLSYGIVRVTALIAYQAIFLSIVSSVYLTQLVRFFGRPFIKVHHVVSIAGLVSMMLHPLMLAWEVGSWSVFVPRWWPPVDFIRFSGRVVWPLVGLAALAAWLRSKWKSWRVVHYLNYVAFWLVTGHAILIGTNFQSLIVRIVAVAMVLATIAVLIRKRLPARGKGRK